MLEAPRSGSVCTGRTSVTAVWQRGLRSAADDPDRDRSVARPDAGDGHSHVLCIGATPTARERTKRLIMRSDFVWHQKPQAVLARLSAAPTIG